MAYVLINHGWTNTRQQGHWQRSLAATLRNQGHQVFYPQYPNTQQPGYSDWSSLFQAELELLLETRAAASGAAATDEVIVIGHSLGCVTFIKCAIDGLIPKNSVSRALLVAPPGSERIDTLPDFEVTGSGSEIRKALDAVTASVWLVGSDDDHWSPRGIQATYGDVLGLTAIVVPGAKHFSSSDGWANYQGVIDWVNDPASDLTVR